LEGCLDEKERANSDNMGNFDKRKSKGWEAEEEWEEES
jgi:hypothetical protein